MECEKFPRVPSRVRGALVKKELSIHNYCKAFAFGSGDGTMEIVKISWPSRQSLGPTLEVLKAEEKKERTSTLLSIENTVNTM